MRDEAASAQVIPFRIVGWQKVRAASRQISAGQLHRQLTGTTDTIRQP
jgi:hypothetical protein